MKPQTCLLETVGRTRVVVVTRLTMRPSLFLAFLAFLAASSARKAAFSAITFWVSSAGGLDAGKTWLTASEYFR